MHDAITAGYNDVIYAATPEKIDAPQGLHPQVAAQAPRRGRQPGGSRRPTLRLQAPSQWRSARTTNAVERLYEEIKRRIKTQTGLPSAGTAATLF